MRYQMKQGYCRTIPVWMSCFTALAALLLAAGTAEGGTDPQPFSPLIGGGLGQTLRITITGTGDLCQATLGFRNQKGESIPEGARVRTVSLKKGESAFHDLNFNAFVNRLGQRLQVCVPNHSTDPKARAAAWDLKDAGLSLEEFLRYL